MTDTLPVAPLAVVGDTAVVDVRQHSSATLHLKGGAVAATGITVLLEATNVENPGATDWFTVVGAASGSVTGATSTPMSAAALGIDTPLGSSYRMNTAGYTYVRARLTARTAGDIVARWSRGAAPVEPVPNAPAPATTVTANPPTGTSYNLVTAATTNGALIVGSACNLDEVTVSNPTATAAFVKFYNKATAPTVGTDVPVLTIPVPANGIVSLAFGTIGKRFATGLGIAVTAGQAATDTAVTVAGIVVNATRH